MLSRGQVPLPLFDPGISQKDSQGRVVNSKSGNRIFNQPNTYVTGW